MENKEEVLDGDLPREDINDTEGALTSDSVGVLPDDEVSDVLANDVNELKQEFSKLCELGDITELNNPTRYAALRDLGLTPREAYLATRPAQKQDNRSHLRSAPAVAAGRSASSMTVREWNIARALFEGLSDGEIEKLYKKVTR